MYAQASVETTQPQTASSTDTAHAGSAGDSEDLSYGKMSLELKNMCTSTGNNGRIDKDEFPRKYCPHIQPYSYCV